MKFNRTRWSVPAILLFCVAALAQAHLPVGGINRKTNSFTATESAVAARKAESAQANLQLIELLESDKEVTGSIPAAAADNNCMLGGKQYLIQIVGGDKKLRVVLGGSSNVNLYIRRDKPVELEQGRIIADAKSDSSGTTEGVTLPLRDTGPLQPGSYFIAVSNCSTTATTYRLIANISDPPDIDVLDLSPVNVLVGSIPAPVPGNCQISHTQYRFSEGFSLCGGGTSWDVTIRADQNVNVLIRRDKPVTVENGVFMYDTMSENQVKVHHLRNFQQTPGGGTFFIAILNCGFEPVNYAITAIQGVGDPLPFTILRVSLKKKKLHVAGLGLQGATVLIDGQPQETIDGGQDKEFPFSDVLIVKNAKKKFPRNQTVIILATRGNGCTTNSFAFTRD